MKGTKSLLHSPTVTRSGGANGSGGENRAAGANGSAGSNRPDGSEASTGVVGMVEVLEKSTKDLGQPRKKDKELFEEAILKERKLSEEKHETFKEEMIKDTNGKLAEHWPSCVVVSSGNMKKDAEPTIEVSNSYPFDVLNLVKNNVDLGITGGTSNLASKKANSSGC
ncbi:hypothetical protein Tco_0311915 [Tanacetum coccineum]